MLTVDEYISNVEPQKKDSFLKLLEIIRTNIPKGFNEEISYKMIGFVVPKFIYPEGYHCNPKLPLPFINLAAQKNFIALYHTGTYAMPHVMDWFTTEYQKQSKTKIDVGKGCIRFKKMDEIPFDLISELMQKISVDEWIKCYETNIKK
ncbi:MAG: DUF1801 domain-containing protein [Flavobacterium sp.]|nr:DUF1801 domain-containing protein [Flavobacterium sp.]